MSGICRPALSGQVDASANVVPCGKKLFDAFACGVGELWLGDSGDDFVTFGAPGVSR